MTEKKKKQQRYKRDIEKIILFGIYVPKDQF